MRSFKILPILGLRTDVAQDDPSLFRVIEEDVAATHDTGGLNVDYVRKKNSCTKSLGYAAWSTSAPASPARMQGMFELDDGVNRDNLIFEKGRTYYYDGAKAPVFLSTSFSSTEGDLFCTIRYGSYMITTDKGNLTPYKWKNGDADLSKLIQSGTEYKFRYLIEWQRRVIGVYSDQTNGDIDLRYSDALPTWATLEFAAANQLYKPTTDSITGISKRGANTVLLYGTDSISRLVYYAGMSQPLAILTAVEGQGTTGHHSIVNAKGANFFFNKNYGFVRYVGGSKIGSKDIISYDIETDLVGIDSRYYDRIVGTYLPFTEQVVWAVPLAGATTPSHLLYYNTRTKQWSKEDKACRYIDTWTKAAGEYQKLVFGNADGHTYSVEGETVPGASNLDGYRVEPIMAFGAPTKFKHIHEIWLGIADGGNYSVDFNWRTGDTVKEVEAASWTSLGSISLNNPTEPKLNVNQHGRLHQIKWGTNLDSEKFSVNWLDFRYTMEDDY